MPFISKCVRGGQVLSTPSGGGDSLPVLYEVDLSALPAADLMTGGDGAKTIGGKVWNLKNTAQAQAVALADGMHAGLYLRCAAVASDYYAGVVDAPRFVVGLDDLHGKTNRELIEQWVLVMFSQPHIPDANYQGCRIGAKLLPDVGDAGRSVHLCRAFNDGLVDTLECRSGGGTVNLYGSVVVPPVTDDVLAFRLLAGYIVEIYSGRSLAGDFPTVSSLKLATIQQFASYNQSPGLSLAFDGISDLARLRWALLIACSASTDASGNSDLLIHRLKVIGR